MSSTLQLRASWSFLDRAHPLKHVATDKKSRLQQAIAEMLTAVLTQLLQQQGGDTRWGGGVCGWGGGGGGRMSEEAR